MLDVFFHRRPVSAAVLNRDHGAVCRDDRRLDRNTLSADHTDLILLTDLHLV